MTACVFSFDFRDIMPVLSVSPGMDGSFTRLFNHHHHHHHPATGGYGVGGHHHVGGGIGVGGGGGGGYAEGVFGGQ